MHDADHMMMILEMTQHRRLVDQFLCQAYKFLRLQKSFKKFCGGYQDFIEKYHLFVKKMVNDLFLGQFYFTPSKIFVVSSMDFSLGFLNTLFYCQM